MPRTNQVTRTRVLADLQCSPPRMHARAHPQIRDFYLFTALKSGDSVSSPSGLQRNADADGAWRGLADSAAAADFGRWASGATGFPFVDACMRELASTGWMR